VTFVVVEVGVQFDNKQKDEKVLPKNMVTKEEKCDLCGCRGYDTVCYYNCGCHKPNDKEVLLKK